MAEKQLKTEEINVKLKPFLGMRPGVYLTILYSFIILVILFILLFFPGLSNPGAMLIVSTKPDGAAIRVNDVYMGVSGERIFVPKGSHTIEVVMPGFEKQSETHEIPGRVFGSRFFPLLYKIDFELYTHDPVRAFSIYAEDYARWTFMGEPTAAWQVPMSLSEGMRRVAPFAVGKEEELEQILAASARFAVTRAALRDLIRAKFLLDNNGGTPSPSTILNSVSDILSFVSQNPGSASWIHDVYPFDSQIATAIRDSTWYQNQQDIDNQPVSTSRVARQIDVGGIVFSQIDDFYIGDAPVPRIIFSSFLEDNPGWNNQITDYFPDEIAVNPMEANRRFVYGVTWFAANEFCKWLSNRLPASMANMEVRLPTEAEWVWASSAIDNMRNPGWEWCNDPYAPLNFIAAELTAINAVSSPERSLRGRPSAASTETRASLPPDLSSPFVTFRPVIAARN